MADPAGQPRTGSPLLSTVAPVFAAAVGSALLILWAGGSTLFAAALFAGALLTAGLIALALRLMPRPPGEAPRTDWLLAATLANQAEEPVAVTDRAGRLVCANDGYRTLVGDRAPVEAWTGAARVDAQPLATAARDAWRDGSASLDDMAAPSGRVALVVTRSGANEALLVWRFRPLAERDRVAEMSDALTGEVGDRLGRAGVMGVLVDGDGRVEAATRAWVHRSSGDLVGPAEAPNIADALQTDDRGAIRFTAEGRDGPPLRLVQIPLEEGGRMALFAVDDAMTAGAMAEGSRDLSSLKLLLDLLAVPLALIDRDGRMLGVNAAMRTLVGEARADARYPGDLVVAEDKGALADHIRRLSGARSTSGDIAVRLADAPDDPVTVTASAVRGFGPVAVLLAVATEQASTSPRGDSGQLNKMEAVGHLAGGVAHDFNNLLTAILGICDLLLMRHVPGDPDFDDIQQIRSNSNRAASLTRHLLAFSRQQTLRPQIVLLPDLLGEVTHLLRRLLGEKIKLEVDHARDQWPVRVDAQQLEQVVVNLAVNARDAMPGGGTLRIQTFPVSAREMRDRPAAGLPVADYTVLRVTDTGPGIPPAVLPKIFDPFFTTKGPGQGTGLGLSTSYGIVRQSGGFISVDRAPGAGARFTIHLPVHTGPVAPRPEPVRSLPSEWGQGTILLIEDEEMVRSVATRALTRAGYTVRAAASGEEALAMLAEDDAADLVVSDVAMPGLDGPETVRAIRERHPTLPVLFMSGYAEGQARERIDIADADFLPKPFSVSQLTTAVGRLIGAVDAG